MTFGYIMWAKGGEMKIKPLFDRVVVDPTTKGNETPSGIVLPETLQERPQIGVIVAIGDGTSFDGNKMEMKVKVGDRVVYNKYVGTELKVDGKTLIILRQIDLIGVLND